jgi:hypothetical protein
MLWEFHMNIQSSVKLVRTRPGPFVFALFVLCSGSPAAGQTPQKPITATITLGIVAETHQKEIEEHFREFVRSVARKISPATALEGKVVVTSTLPDLAKLLDHGTVDFYMESPYPTYVVNNVHGAGTLLLRRWKSGMADYRSLIFTQRNSGIQRLDDLRGKLIAFEDPESSSGYFLPKLFLQRNGLRLAEKPGLDANVGAAEVGFVFARSQKTLVDWVLSKTPRLAPSATTITPPSTRRYETTSWCWRRPICCRVTFYRCAKTCRLGWSAASKRHCSRCMRTPKAARYCKTSTARLSSAPCPAGRRLCAEGFWIVFTHPRENEIRLFGTFETALLRTAGMNLSSGSCM